jgi:hypothetical protein
MAHLPQGEDMSSFTIGQMNQLSNKLVAEGLDPPLVTRLGQASPEIHKALGCEVSRLSAFTPVIIPSADEDILEFFKACKGLWLSENFKNFILAAARPGVVEVPATIIGQADLILPASDAEIAAEAPGDLVFEDVDFFLSYLKRLIQVQSDGKPGVLLTSGKVNTLRVKGLNNEDFAVFVGWCSDDGEWYCHAVRLDVTRWGAGDRVFSATATLT